MPRNEIFMKLRQTKLRNAVRLLALLLAVTAIAAGLCVSTNAEEASMKKVTSLFPRLYGNWAGDRKSHV